MTCTDPNTGEPCVAMSARLYDYDAQPHCDAFGVELQVEPQGRRSPGIQRCSDCRARFRYPDQDAIALLTVRRAKGAP
jgi:hypothetical protein